MPGIEIGWIKDHRVTLNMPVTVSHNSQDNNLTNIILITISFSDHLGNYNYLIRKIPVSFLFIIDKISYIILINMYYNWTAIYHIRIIVAYT